MTPRSGSPPRHPHPRHREARHALQHWPVLRRAFRGAGQLVLLTDFDGTLSPIVPRPERARMARGMRTLLRRAHALNRVTVGIVSGRSLRTIRRLVGLPALLYIGNHGTEVSAPGLRFAHPVARRTAPLMRRLGGELRRALRNIPGSQVEFKGASLSVHWRRVRARQVPAFGRAVRRVLRAPVRTGMVRVTRGKRVIEVRPPIDWDKGRGLEWVVKHLRGRRPTRVCYLGDDRTDEDAFRSVNRLRGISIVVGARPGRTRARWWVKDPSQVRELLARVLVLFREPSGRLR